MENPSGTAVRHDTPGGRGGPEAEEVAADPGDAGSQAEATGEATRRGVGPPPSTEPASQDS